MNTTTRCFVGLSLGQAQQFTAVAVLERSLPDPSAFLPRYALRHLQRFPLGMSYPAITMAVRTLLQTALLRRAVVGVDQTGMGRAVRVLLAQGLQGQVECLFCPLTLTVGQEVTRGTLGGWYVPHQEIVGTLQVLLQTRRLALPRSLPETEILARELASFSIRPRRTTSETLESWREGPQDDLVLACGVAAWLGEMARGTAEKHGGQ